MAGKSAPVSRLALKMNDPLTTNKLDNANILADSIAETSSGSSYSARFFTLKAEQERKAPSFQRKGSAEFPYNLLFTRRELDSALSLYRKTAPGSDDIP